MNPTPPITAVVFVALAGCAQTPAPEPPPLEPDAISASPRADTVPANKGQVTYVEALHAHLAQCWRMPVDLPGSQPRVVRLRIALNTDGTLASRPRIIDLASQAEDPALALAQASAFRAVLACEPYDFLPVDRYEEWRDVELVFAPER